MKVKRFLMIFLSLLLVSAISLLSVSAALPSAIAGDTDGDAERTVKDATLLQKHIAGIVKLSGEAPVVSDVDGDGVLTVRDATMIQKRCAGVIDSFCIPDEIGRDLYLYSFNYDYDSGNAMVGVPVNFSVFAVGLPEPIVYSFFVDDVLIYEDTDSTFTYTFDKAGVYDLKVIVRSKFDYTRIAETKYEVVEAYESDTVKIKAFYHNGTEICLDTVHDLELTAAAIFGSGEYEYAFYVDDELVRDFSTENTYNVGCFDEKREYTLAVKVRDVVTGDVDYKDMTILIGESFVY